MITFAIYLNKRAMNDKKKCRLMFFLPLALFLAYLVLVLTGGIASWAGAGERFFCGFYCYAGLAIFGIILIYFFINCGLSGLFRKTGKERK